MDAVLAQLIEIKQELKRLKPSEIIGGKCHYNEACRCQRFVSSNSNVNTCLGCGHCLSFHAIYEPDTKIILDPKYLIDPKNHWTHLFKT
jgi:hypothetical protein